MTSKEIRQSYLEFFREKRHTIVPSSSLLPDSPNLLFTNAGMNQFVPIFLGQQKPGWNPPRALFLERSGQNGLTLNLGLLLRLAVAAHLGNEERTKLFSRG